MQYAVWMISCCALTAAVRSKLFDIVGHLDLIKVFGYRPRSSSSAYAEAAISRGRRSWCGTQDT